MSFIGTIATFGLFLLVGYALLAALVTLNQRSLIYKPDPRRATPASSGLPFVKAVAIATPDGETLVAWYAQATPGKPTILYFHGNAGYLELRADRMSDLARRGYGVLMPFYRGYAGSTGRPSERANVADASCAYNWLRMCGVPATAIVLFGESLGTGVASQLAVSVHSVGLILDSPFTSMIDLGAKDYPWLPISYLIKDRYESIRHIEALTVPLLVIHGEADTLVPVAMGQRVHDAAGSPKQLIVYPGARHLDHRQIGSFDDVARWIDALPSRVLPIKHRVNAADALADDA